MFEIVDSEFDAEMARERYKWEKKERELDPYSPPTWRTRNS